MSDWKYTTLGDLIQLQRGHDLPSQDRLPGTVPVIGSFGITGSHKVSKYKGPGVAIGRSGASIGCATFVDEPYWPLNTCLFVSDFKANDPRWVYRLLGQIDFMAFNSGSAQPSLNRNFLRSIPVLVPSRKEQQAIAEVLGALDDKIAANKILASTAEALTAALFTKSVHGVELSRKTFDDIAAVRGGGTPRTGIDEYWDGDISWVTPTDVTALSGPYLERTSRRITKEGLEACASPLYPAGSILMTSRATIGAFAVAQKPTATNQGFIVVNPRDPSLNWWIFHEMRSRVDEFISLANGATFLELSRGNFKKFRVRLTDESAMKAFGVTVDALHSRARQAHVESALLAETRDVLLPQLMSGKIRVKDVEQMVGDVV